MPSESAREALNKSHMGRCGRNGPWVRRFGTSIPAAGCKCQANTAGPRATPRSQRLCGLWLGSPQPEGLKPVVDFCLAVSRRSRPPDCFAGYDAAPAGRRCGVARSDETAAGIDSLAPARLALTGLPAANLPKQPPQLRVAQRSRLQKSATDLQRPSWDLFSASLVSMPLASFLQKRLPWKSGPAKLLG
jgi:hypothetical protein